MKELEQAFTPSPFVFSEVSELIDNSRDYHPNEYEHIEETSAFLNRTWMAIDPSLLEEHYWAFHYFNTKAFAHFIPSVLSCGTKNFDVVNDACRIILTYINIVNDGIVQRCLKSTLNIEQLKFLIFWISNNIKNYEHYGYKLEAEAAIDNIKQHLCYRTSC